MAIETIPILDAVLNTEKIEVISVEIAAIINSGKNATFNSASETIAYTIQDVNAALKENTANNNEIIPINLRYLTASILSVYHTSKIKSNT